MARGVKKAFTREGVAQLSAPRGGLREIGDAVQRGLVLRIGETDLSKADIHKLLDDLVATDCHGTAREVRKMMSRLMNWADSHNVNQLDSSTENVDPLSGCRSTRACRSKSSTSKSRLPEQGCREPV
jgi:hypothetical protein